MNFSKSHGFLPVLLLSLTFFVSACGFQPVYQESHSHQGLQGNGTVQNAFDTIAVSQIPDRIGQNLRNQLIDNLYQNGTPQNPNYRLDIEITSVKTAQRGITREATTTREQVNIEAKIRLFDLKAPSEGSPTLVLERPIETLATYNVLANQYSTLISREQAQERALSLMANDITRALSLYFKRVEAEKTGL